MPSAVTVPVVPRQPSSLSLGGLLVLAFGALDFGLESSIVLPALPVIGFTNYHRSGNTVSIKSI